MFRNVIPSIFLVVQFSACAQPVDETCTFQDKIYANAIGPLKIGNTFDKYNPDFEVYPSVVPYSDRAGFEVKLCADKISILVEIDENDKIVTLITADETFSTLEGAKVNMSILELQSLYPRGVVSTGVEEGGWIAFKPKNVSGYFEFKLDGITRMCLRDNMTCPKNFYEQKSIRYWVTD